MDEFNVIPSTKWWWWWIDDEIFYGDFSEQNDDDDELMMKYFMVTFQNDLEDAMEKARSFKVALDNSYKYDLWITFKSQFASLFNPTLIYPSKWPRKECAWFIFSQTWNKILINSFHNLIPWHLWKISTEFCIGFSFHFYLFYE